MASKRFPAAHAKKNATRVGRALGDKALPGAHPRLIHGFLVDLVVKQSGRTAAPKSAPAAASMRPRGQFPADTKHEGPADDSTFH